MSRAFVKDQDGSDAFEELPEKLVSDGPNLVTPEGLAHIDAEVERLTRDYGAAQAAGDRAALNLAARDLRYWSARQSSAEVVPPPADTSEVRFGSKVTIARDDGRRHAYRLTGEDEADPKKGCISFVSPLARALMGKSVGDEVSVAGATAVVIKIE